MQSSNQILIRVSDVTMRRDCRTILSHVNLDVRKGDFLAITGPNGGGKTTLLRIILKLLKPTSGSVSYIAKKEGGMPKIGYLPQKNMIDSRFPITVSQVISSGVTVRNSLDKVASAQKVEEILQLVDLADRRDFTIGQLSGGQLQRALIGRALISQPEILVMDEPLSYLDKPFEARIYDIIASLAPVTTILLVSHEMSRISSMANRHIIINKTLEECSAGHHYFTMDCPCPSNHHTDK